jgi:hypothetical protein
MEIKLNTDNYSTTYDLYKLARGVFYHLDHEGIKIDYYDGVYTSPSNADNDLHQNVTITFKEFGWHEAMKLETFMDLANRLTDYTSITQTEEEE